VDVASIVRAPPAAEPAPEMPEGTEVNSTNELLREDPVEPLELPSGSRVVRIPGDHPNAVFPAEPPELP